MRKMILTAGALALTLSIAGGANAKPGGGHGSGHGNGHGNGQAWNHEGGRGDDVDDNDEHEGRGQAIRMARGCPPGLAKKNNGCLPPGLARRTGWTQGARLPTGYSRWSNYNAIPSQYRNMVNYDPNLRYVYRDNTVYTVNPRTRIVQSVINLLNR